MKNILVIAILVAALSAAASPQNPPAGQKGSGSQANPATNPNSGKTPPKRVRADLSGFELAPKKSSSDSAVQIGGGTRGGLPGPFLYAPHKGKTFSTTPVFYWGQHTAATDFKFTLYDSDDNVVYEASVHGKSLAYPADAAHLKPGSSYSWTIQLSGVAMAEPAEAVDFTVLSTPEHQKIQVALNAIAGNSEQNEIRRAKVFVDARLWYDAVAVYSALIAKYPNNALLYKARGEIYDQLPITRELADQDFARAESFQPAANKK
ncbi:MAG: DUF928 domain-containing protein [Candidatus Acidiferrales bacterium]